MISFSKIKELLKRIFGCADGFSVKFPKKWQWKSFFVVLGKKEKIILSCLTTMFLASGLVLIFNLYFSRTEAIPAGGGVYREGVLGQPKFVNPIYISTQDVDRDLVELIFSGLMKYDGQAHLTTDLAESYEVKEGGRVFEFSLKDNVFWHDNEKFTADDVIFTVNLVQNPECQSPLRIKWSGIVAEKISDTKVRFLLPKSYVGFLENATLKILPKHIFENTPSRDLPSALFAKNNLTGTGPFKFDRATRDKSDFVEKVVLRENTRYFASKPFLSKIVFVFFKNEKDLLKSFALQEIDGFSVSSPQSLAQSQKKGNHILEIEAPRYFALFFNLAKDGVGSSEKLREALAFGVNKEEIIKEVFQGKAKTVDSPILSGFFDFAPPDEIFGWDRQKAGKTLDDLGFKLNEQTGFREKTLPKTQSFVFKSNLSAGSKGQEVKKLQECLSITASGSFGSETKAAVIKFQEKYASDILKPANISKGTGDVKASTRKKLNEVCFPQAPASSTPLEINVVSTDNFPLAQISQIIKAQWEALGVKTNIKTVSLADLQSAVLTKKDYDVLLFGEALGAVPDPFPFWHSSQKDYPGLNLSAYSSRQADKLLEQGRELFASSTQKQKPYLESFQNVLLNDLPAIFLVRPEYLYLLSDKVKGVAIEKITEPAKRFSDIEKWYIKTKREWK
ncbi:MAG: ABC transporter substrate-binding protein [Patescibacteria group bacterium]|nr:ABC transporter substrate-binding protein [Patescibacteria group bacterium]